jgi:hypothetical membrane protein
MNPPHTEKPGASLPATVKVAAACGLVGPGIYVVVLTILGAIYPGYSHVSQTMSVLGAIDAPHRAVMNTLGFPLLAVSIVAFAYAVDRGIPRFGAVSWAGPLLIVISGVALAMTAVFTGDPENVDASWRGTTHSAFAVVAAVSFAIAPLFIGLRQWHDRRWRRHTIYSDVTASVTLALSWVSSLDALDAYAGLLQRISMGIPMIWMMVTSARLLAVSPRGRQVGTLST